MKIFLALGIAMSVSAAGGAHAAPSDYSDFIVVSVLPRNPSVQPFVMSVPPKERPKQAVSLKLDAFDAKR